jgi:hypothetical protein
MEIDPSDLYKHFSVEVNSEYLSIDLHHSIKCEWVHARAALYLCDAILWPATNEQNDSAGRSLDGYSSHLNIG